MKRSESNSRKHFLVVSTTGIGDTLMGTPALRALRESFPESAIHLLVNSRRKDLVAGNPHVDRILEYRNNSLFRALLFFKALPFYYDTVLVFHVNDLWKILRNVRYGVCLNRQGYRDPERKVIPFDQLPKHTVQKRLALVERAGGKKSEDYRYDFTLSQEHTRWAQKKMAEWGMEPGERLVGMQIGAADRYKCWPLESFAEVAGYLQKKYQFKIYLNGSPGEKDIIKRFAARMGGRGVYHYSSNSLLRSAALIQACSLFISNDTGPLHMAFALKVPLLGLFCPTDAEVTGPLGHPQAVSLQKTIPCKPCRVKKEMPHARLIVAGKDRVQDYQKRTRRLGVEKDTLFRGPTQRARELYAASDLFALPTYYDPFSNACLEAMATGIPVLTTPTNGVSELIKDQENGFLIQKPSDVMAIAKKIIDFGFFREKEEIGHRAREATSSLNMDRVISKIHSVYGSLQRQRR
jgi:ADP-heptose:LPS heptosyltransferase